MNDEGEIAMREAPKDDEGADEGNGQGECQAIGCEVGRTSGAGGIANQGG